MIRPEQRQLQFQVSFQPDRPIDGVVPVLTPTVQSTFDPKGLNTQLRKGEITPEEFLKILRENDILYDKTQDGNMIIITYEYNGKEYEVNCRVNSDNKDDNNGSNGKDDLGGSKPTVDDPIPSTPPAVTPPATTIDFADYKSLRNYVFGNLRSENQIKDLNFKDKGFCYEQIAETVCKVHEKDFATITKEQLLNEFIAEYNKHAAENTATKPTQDPTPSPEPEPDPAPTPNQTPTMNPDEKIKNAANDLKNPVGDVSESIVAVCKEAIGYKNNINIGYSLDASGNINFANNADAKKVFDTILDKLKSRINRYAKDALEAIGGEAMLKKLLQSAWIDASSGNSSTVNTTDFINKVMKNLDQILDKVATNPEYLDYYTDDCYRDSSLTNGLPNLNGTVNHKNPRKYDTGEMHLDDDASDKKFQETMNKLLENIYNKYSNIDKGYLKTLFNKAQGNALSYKDLPQGTNLGKMSDLVNLVLYHFDKLFKADAKTKTFAARTADAPAKQAQSSQTSQKNDDIKAGANGITNCVEDVAESIAAVCKEAIGYKNKIHTEFGMDKNGNIVFQEKDTQKVFDTILEKLKSRINRYAKDALQKLGGEAALKQLLQVAWMTTYNDFNSSQENNTTDFINKVMTNLGKILDKLQTNPELMEVFTTRGSYADDTVTNGLKHYGTRTTYGNDEVISYGGTPTIYADGSVHLSDTNDDNDYQTTMSDLLQRLIKKYPSVDSSKITSVFQNAQYKALHALQSNAYDCPYGTGNNSGRVEDSTKNWGGKDNRKDDKSRIDMDELVQMTLYYFDKLIYAELLK